ncbi:MAG: hypothetical protein K8T20_19035 [Planctomycetes bacterium]|nr:hypothetical protein [Planctomycetota bacterium]
MEPSRDRRANFLPSRSSRRLPFAVTLTLSISTLTFFTLLACTFVGCERRLSPPERSWLRGRSIHSEKIAVPYAVEIPADAWLISIGNDGKLILDGSIIDERELTKMSPRETESGTRRQSLVFECREADSFSGVLTSIAPALRADFCRIGFLVNCENQLRAVPLPVLRGDSVWQLGREVSVLKGGQGTPRVEIRIGVDSHAKVRLTTIETVVWNTVDFPDADRPAGAETGGPVRAPWSGQRPLNGPIEPGDLTEFVRRSEVQAMSPYVVVQLSGDEDMADVLHCLSLAFSAVDLVIIH